MYDKGGIQPRLCEGCRAGPAQCVSTDGQPGRVNQPGAHEAVELRDGNAKKYFGKGLDTLIKTMKDLSRESDFRIFLLRRNTLLSSSD